MKTCWGPMGLRYSRPKWLLLATQTLMTSVLGEWDLEFWVVFICGYFKFLVSEVSWVVEVMTLV